MTSRLSISPLQTCVCGTQVESGLAVIGPKRTRSRTCSYSTWSANYSRCPDVSTSFTCHAAAAKAPAGADRLKAPPCPEVTRPNPDECMSAAWRMPVRRTVRSPTPPSRV